MAKEDLLTKHQQAYETLKKVRSSKTVTLKPSKMLRTTFKALNGNVEPVRLRYYQVQAVYHLLTMRRMVLGDATGTGKSLSLIASLCYMWEKEPNNKAVIVSPKSALRQWEAEIHKFADGIQTYLVDGTPAQRKAVYEAFQGHASNTTKAVMLIGYAPLVRDWSLGAHVPKLPNGHPDPKGVPTPGLLEGILTKVPDLVVAYDEAAAFKSDRTKTWQVCGQLSGAAVRCYGLTATMLKNNLIEGFAIFKVIYPAVFTTKTQFYADYCVTKLQAISGSARKIPIVVGYKNLNGFRDRIDPFYLGRPKHAISDELPKLITREVPVRLTQAESLKYEEALSGVISLGDGEAKDYEQNKAMVSLIYCQQVVDSLSLLKFKGGELLDTDVFHDEQVEVSAVSSKEQALLDLLTEEFDDDKVIVYCRFASLIPRLQMLCKEKGVESVAVTGAVKDTAKNPARRRAQEAFQDLKSKVRVIFISDAGSEAINLQAAAAMIFYNSPWSWGNYVQLLGRPIRIGSPHQHVTAVHLVAERPGRTEKTRQTIDHHTLSILQSKKALIDKVLGESAVGALEFEKGTNFVQALSDSLRSGVGDD